MRNEYLSNVSQIFLKEERFKRNDICLKAVYIHVVKIGSRKGSLLIVIY